MEEEGIIDDSHNYFLVYYSVVSFFASSHYSQYMQNAHLCTRELLESAVTSLTETSSCECYSFCNDQFVRCHDHPGGLLEEEECIGIPISGCNWAMLEELEKDDNVRDRSSAAAAGKHHRGILVWMTWIVVLVRMMRRNDPFLPLVVV